MVLFNNFSNRNNYRNLFYNINEENKESENSENKESENSENKELENICNDCDNDIISENVVNENIVNKLMIISIKKALECTICLNVSTLPVHPVCCINSKSMSPACLKCVRDYLQLNKPIHLRSTIIKSWNGCGCDIYTNLYGAGSYYKHTFELDSVRNIIGKSKCFNEGCNAEFSTGSELRKHLNGPTDDKLFGICQEAFIKCTLCNYFDKRRIILVILQ